MWTTFVVVQPSDACLQMALWMLTDTPLMRVGTTVHHSHLHNSHQCRNYNDFAFKFSARTERVQCTDMCVVGISSTLG